LLFLLYQRASWHRSTIATRASLSYVVNLAGRPTRERRPIESKQQDRDKAARASGGYQEIGTARCNSPGKAIGAGARPARRFKSDLADGDP
ncbi:MAG TPA: hypothetical protein VGN34_27645, partial [Ktedonobacteraceae bacterium]